MCVLGRLSILSVVYLCLSITGGFASTSPRLSSSDCFEYGYEYKGYDIENLYNVDSPSKCMSECASYRGCAFWSYDTLSNKCNLKSAAAFTERVSSPGVISGSSQCVFTSNCYEEGVDYYGYDIEKVENRYILTPIDCQRLCAANPQCAYFTWRAADTSCYLKSAAAVLGRREEKDVVSGPRACHTSTPSYPSYPSYPPYYPPYPSYPPPLSPPLPSFPPYSPPLASDYPSPFDPADSPASCLESGVDYRGYTIKSIKARSAAACQRTCLLSNDCYFWTYNSQSLACFLKSGSATLGRYSDKHTLDYVSAHKECVPVIPGCQYAGVGVVGVRLQTLSADSLDVCQFHCATFSGCSHFSHDVKSAECTLWAAADGYAKGPSTEGLVSGPAACEAEEVCYEQSDYVGYNVEEDESGLISSPSQCQSLCRKREDCYYWTWYKDNNGCYLKSADALLGRTNDTTALGRFSGPKWCSISYGCVQLNSAFVGLPLSQSETSDYVACSKKCASTIFCSSWSYYTDLSLCSLFSGLAPVASRSIRGTISADVSCQVQSSKDAEEEEHCFEEGLLYSRDNVAAMHECSSASECYRLCQSNVNCKTWTFKGGDSCFLLPTPSPSFVFDPLSISGSRVCGGETSLSSYGVQGKGTPLSVSFVYSPKACLNRCLLTPSCKFWTFAPSLDNNCLLYGKSYSAAMSDENTVSGFIPFSLLSTSCTFQEPIASLVVAKPILCHAECQANPSCRAWQAKYVKLKNGKAAPSHTYSASYPASHASAYPKTSPNRSLATSKGTSSSVASSYLPSTLSSSASSTSSVVVCTLFSSDDQPTFITDTNTLCGTLILPGKIQENVAMNIQDQNAVQEEATTLEACVGFCTSQPSCVAISFRFGEQCRALSSIVNTRTEEGSYSVAIDRPSSPILFHTSYSPINSGTAKETAVSSAASHRFAGAFAKRLLAKNSRSAATAASAAEAAAAVTLEASSYEECVSACKTDNTCTAWTFKDDTCFLLNSAGLPVYEENAISGTRSSSSADYQFVLGKKYTGTAVYSWPPQEAAASGAAAAAARTSQDLTETEPPETAAECASKAAEGQCWSYKPAVVDGVAECSVHTECTALTEAEGYVSGSARGSSSEPSPPDVQVEDEEE